MNKQMIISELIEKHNSFVAYINGLTTEEYLFCYQDKWPAALQLAHIVLCVKPLVQVFGMDKSALAQTFGVTDRQGRTYELLLNEYRGKLQDGGKAPERYIPGAEVSTERITCGNPLLQAIADLCAGIAGFTEEELDTYLVPHPLMGKLTMREMLYNAIYHVQHHQEQARQILSHNK